MNQQLFLSEIEHPKWEGKIKEIMESHEGAVPIPEQKDEGRHLETRNAFWYRATIGEEIVGIGRLEEKEASSFEVTILIDNNYVGKGYGKNFLNKLEIEALKHGASSIIAIVSPENTRAEHVVSWFESEGYKVLTPGDTNILLRAGIPIQLIKIIDES